MSMRRLSVSLVCLALAPPACDDPDGNDATRETEAETAEGSSSGEVLGTWRVDYAESICLSTVGSLIRGPQGTLWSSNGTGLFEWMQVDGRYEPELRLETGVMALRHYEGWTYGLLPGEGLVQLDEDGRDTMLVEGTYVAYAIGKGGAVALVGPDPERALFLWSENAELQRVAFPDADDPFGVRAQAVIWRDATLLVYTRGGEPHRRLWALGSDGSLEPRSELDPEMPDAEVLYASEDRLWVPVDFGRTDAWLAVSDDEGRTFQALELPEDFEPGAMDARGSDVVIVDDHPERALVSVDGGHTFELEPIDVGSDDLPPDSAGVFVMPDRHVFVTTYCTGLIHRNDPLTE